jgi:hypothetical protein
MTAQHGPPLSVRCHGTVFVLQLIKLERKFIGGQLQESQKDQDDKVELMLSHGLSVY